jgi:serine/threonine protein kinase
MITLCGWFMESLTPPNLGRHIGKYEILAFIGRGGMATVHRARLLGPAQASKEVALKLFHGHLSLDNNFVLMFLDEMRVAMALSHRNIVQTFDADRDGDTYFMVMELVDGFSASQLVQLNRGRSPLPLDIAVFIGMEVCAALDYAHNLQAVAGEPAGVIHRDLSPGNILISRQGDVKLADFGVAKVAGSLSTTAAHAVKGKLDYMAPEQAQGQVTHHSDLFSLGAVIYEMIGGQGIRSDPSLNAVRAYSSAPMPISARRPEIPASLEALVMGCLAPAPGERPPDARTLRQQLRQEHDRLIQHAPGIDPDPHARLQTYLEPLLASVAAPGANDNPAARLAQVMFDQVKDLPVDPTAQAVLARAPSQHTPLAVPVVEPPRAAEEIPQDIVIETALTIERRHIRRRSPLIITGIAILAMIVGGLILWWIQEDHDKKSASPPLAMIPAPDAAPLPADISTPDTAPPPDLSIPADVSVDQSPPPPPRKNRWKRRWRSKKRQVRRQPGRLFLNTQPWTTVYIDGKHVGTTPIQGLKLAAGKHRIRLVNTKQKVSRTITVRIRSGKSLRKVIVLH